MKPITEEVPTLVKFEAKVFEIELETSGQRHAVIQLQPVTKLGTDGVHVTQPAFLMRLDFAQQFAEQVRAMALKHAGNMPTAPKMQ